MAGSSHGHTPAAWVGVTIAFIGFCISGAFMVMAEPVGFWAGLVVAALGGVVGWIMSAMGMGKDKGADARFHELARKALEAEKAAARG
ncbi:hypothetical protein OK074_3914 [Actinobacteria bacterium OK074]|nr:hypothetical protein OK074_3914 [Actinobacteria bacterium OK074]